MKTLETNIWYADEARAKSPKKILTYTDTGSLSHDGSDLKFSGEKTTLHMDSISRIYLDRPSLNWVTYLVGALIFAFLDLMVGSGIEALLNTQWVLTKLYVFVAPLCILLFWYPLKWIAVEYEAKGELRKAYFSLGELSGFKALFGGNRKLLQELDESVLNTVISR